MGWSYGTNSDGREVGYSVQATCDLDGCEEEIDRGLAYVCGEMHGSDENLCGGYFCSSHLYMGLGLPHQMCGNCSEEYEKNHPEEVAKAMAEFEAHRDKWHEHC